MKLKLIAIAAITAISIAAKGGVIVKNGEKIAFMGDSITQMGAYPLGYIDLVMQGLDEVGVKAGKIPAGQGGNCAAHMLKRLDRFALSKKPKWMTFSCGINDVWHQDRGEGRGTKFEKFRELVNEIFDKCVASNVTPIVLTSTVYEERHKNADIHNEKIKAYNDFLRETAKKRGFPLADVNCDMQDAKGPFTFDGVHMNYTGDRVIAWSILKAMGVKEGDKKRIETKWDSLNGYPVDIPKDPSKIKIYLMIGQSNMAGRGEFTEKKPLSDDRIVMLDQRCKWVKAYDPMNFDGPGAKVSMGMTFAQTMADANPGIKIGIIPCAVGGSAISRWMPGKGCFDTALRRVKRVKNFGPIAGVIWHQGETDANDPKLGAIYEQELEKMINIWRTELKNPNLPFVVGELGRFIDPKKFPMMKEVNDASKSVAEKLPNVRYVTSEGLTHKGDILHFDTPSLRTLGVRYGEAMKSMESK